MFVVSVACLLQFQGFTSQHKSRKYSILKELGQLTLDIEDLITVMRARMMKRLKCSETTDVVEEFDDLVGEMKTLMDDQKFDVAQDLSL